jgi:hypothetical protein
MSVAILSHISGNEEHETVATWGEKLDDEIPWE